MPDPTIFELVGFTIAPSRPLSRSDQELLQLDLAALLASLAFPPPEVATIAFDLRYLAIADTSLTNKQLLVALLARLDFSDEAGQGDTKQITGDFKRDFEDLLSVHLEAYDYRIAPLGVDKIWRYLEPFTAKDYVEITRRVSRVRPFKLSRFQGHSPMTHAVDILLRQPAQTCLSIYLEPHPLTEDERAAIEAFGYETDVLPDEDRDARALRALDLPTDFGETGSASTPFRVAIRIASEAPITQYLINLVGSEISGRRDYAFQRATSKGLPEAAEALRNLSFFTPNTDPVLDSLPSPLRGLVHLFQPAEALSAFRLPTERIATSRERTYRTYAAPVANLPTEGQLLGHAEHPSYPRPVPVNIMLSDRRRHMYVVGKTGTGKSMLLLNMIAADLASGAGVCLIDPHGDLVDAVFRHIPISRIGDVVLIDPADPERVAGLNFLQPTDPYDESEKDFLVQEIITMIMRMVDYDIAMYGPVGQQMTRMACRTLMAAQRPMTLLEVPRLFSSDSFRKLVLSEVSDPELIRWWKEEWESKTPYQRNEVLGWFTSKFEQFVSAPAVRHFVGQERSTFDVKHLMDNGAIVLVNLSRGKLGPLNSAALGGMIVSKLLWAATTRAWASEDARRDFFLYVDEFQNFVSDSFETILSEARKYRLNLVMAHQHVGQLTSMGRLGSRIERAVFGNVGTIVCFRVGTDASRLAEELGAPAEASTLRSLENRYAVAQILVDNVPTVPFTMRTADYIVPGGSVERDAAAPDVRGAARQRNTPIPDIESQIRARWGLEGPV